MRGSRLAKVNIPNDLQHDEAVAPWIRVVDVALELPDEHIGVGRIPMQCTRQRMQSTYLCDGASNDLRRISKSMGYRCPCESTMGCSSEEPKDVRLRHDVGVGLHEEKVVLH